MKKRTIQALWILLLTIAVFTGCTSAKVANEPLQSIKATQATTNSAADNKPKQIEPSDTQKKATEPVESDSNSGLAVEPKVVTNGELTVHYIDVGQGASQLIIGPMGKTILIDAGNNNQESVVVNYLKKQKISKIDILIGTHPDADHIGGLDAVIDSFEIGKIYMPNVQSNTKTFEDVLLAIQRKGLKVTTAKAGLVLDWESDATVEMIAPVANYPDTNDMSAVIHLTYGQKSFLFTGDAESKSEQDMISSKVNLRSDVLLVGHHGSKSSTSQAFLDAVKPTYAVIQVGKDNNYGHPTAVVLQRLSAMGVKTYRTDERGNIIFTTNGKEIKVNVSGEEGRDASTGQAKLPTAVELTNSPKQQQQDVVYKNCTEVKAAGKAPLHRGDLGYSTKLDRDGDGVACE
jgi:competence protein ComEC